MACDLISNMEAAGFTLANTGGNCRAMVQRIGGRMIVATSTDGDLPYEGDFLVALYDGDWLADPDCAELCSLTLADGTIDEALERARAAAEGGR